MDTSTPKTAAVMVDPTYVAWLLLSLPDISLPGVVQALISVIFTYKFTLRRKQSSPARYYSRNMKKFWGGRWLVISLRDILWHIFLPLVSSSQWFDKLYRCMNVENTTMYILVYINFAIGFALQSFALYYGFDRDLISRIPLRDNGRWYKEYSWQEGGQCSTLCMWGESEACGDHLPISYKEKCRWRAFINRCDKEKL